MNAKTKQQGFSLIEVIATVAIIAILATFAMPKIGNIQDKASLAKAQEIASTAHRSYRIDKDIHYMNQTIDEYELAKIADVLELDSDLKAVELAYATATATATGRNQSEPCATLTTSLKNGTASRSKIKVINIPAQNPSSAVFVFSDSTADSKLQAIQAMNNGVKTNSFTISTGKTLLIGSAPCALTQGT